jgi:hypothetical protein
MSGVQRAPTRSVAIRMKRRLQRLAKQEHEPSARAARSVLAGDPHEHYPAFVSKPYMRQGHLRLSKPARIGWHYVLPGLAAICVGQAKARHDVHISVQPATFTEHLQEAVHATTASQRRARPSQTLAVLHVPELMLLLLWIRDGSRSRYRVLEPSHVHAPRGVLLSPARLDRLATKIARALGAGRSS